MVRAVLGLDPVFWLPHHRHESSFILTALASIDGANC